MTDIVTSRGKIIQKRFNNVSRSPNNPPPEFFSGAENPSLHDRVFSNTSGHLISVNIANHFTPGNFHSLAQLSSENQDLQSELGQVMEEYPAARGPPAPGKPNKTFALNRDNLEVETAGTSYLIYFSQADDFGIDPRFTNAMGSGSWSSTNSSPVIMQHPTLQNVRIRSTRDALQVFHGVATHRLPLITRRLDAEERINIVPGNVYVWSVFTLQS